MPQALPVIEHEAQEKTYQGSNYCSKKAQTARNYCAKNRAAERAVAHDYPATFENDDFALILTPRVEHD